MIGMLLLAVVAPLASDEPFDYGEVNVWAVTAHDTSPYLAEILQEERCADVVPIALDAMWEQEQIPQLMKIIWRESRCFPDACAEPDRPDLRKCRDWGLLQVNDHSWRKKVELFNLKMEQMLDPYYNLVFGKWLYDYSTELVGDGWYQWDMKHQLDEG